MRPVRIITALAFAAAVAVAGCAGHTDDRPPAPVSAPGEPPAAASATPADPAVPATPADPGAARPADPGAARPAAPAPAPANRPVACRGGQLELRRGPTEGAMGHRYLSYGLRNRSGVVCTLSGAPAVRLLDATGDVLPTVLQDGFFGITGPDRVLVRPGGSAYFTVAEAVLAQEGDAQPCPAASTLVVTPPGQGQALSIAQAMAPCGGRLWVSPVRPTVGPTS